MDSDLAAFGIDRPDAAAFLADAETEYPVLPENWDAVTLFLRCATQWRYAGMTGVRTGLDYPAVEAVMRITGVTNHRETFEKIQLIEQGALAALAEQQDRT